MSWAASLRSKSIEALISSMISAGPAANRPPHILLLMRQSPGSNNERNEEAESVEALSRVAALAVAAAAARRPLRDGAGPGKSARPAPPASLARAQSLAPFAKGELAALAVVRPRAPPTLAFKGPDGAPLTLANFNGRALVLNLWATWCVPCRAEMPALDRLEAEAGSQHFEVVAVDVDTARLDRGPALLDELGVKALKRYADPSGDAFEALRAAGIALGLPTSLLIDKEGCELGVVAGAANWTSPTRSPRLKRRAGGNGAQASV